MTTDTLIIDLEQLRAETTLPPPLRPQVTPDELAALLDIACAAAVWARARQALPEHRSMLDDRLVIALERAGLK